MGLDPLSPVAPARVRCLLVPCGLITRARFLEFLKRLQDEAVVRLSDVSPNAQPERNTFSPLAFPQGAIVFDFVVSDSSQGQKALFPYEICREPLLVLGIADGLENGAVEGVSSNHTGGDSLSQEKPAQSGDLFAYLETAAERLRAVGNVSLLRKVFIFDYDAKTPEKDKTMIPVPALDSSTTAAMKTIMGDLASELLSEMAAYVRSIQSLPTIETPKQTMPDGYIPPQEPEPDSKRQSWFPGGRSSSPSLALQKLGQRASMPAHLFQPALNSPTDNNHPRSEATSPTGDSAATSFEQMSLTRERRAMQLDGVAQDRASAQALGSDPVSDRMRNQGRGRVSIVVGQLYLAAGRWADAMRDLVQGGVMARSTNDHIWHAKAVELIVVTLLMCSWAGVDFEIPQLCLPIAERSSVLLGKSSKKNEPININETYILQSATKEAQVESIKNFANALPDIINHIIRLYTRTTAEHVSQLALSESFIRLSKLSCYLLTFPGLSTAAALESLVLNIPAKANADNAAILSPSIPTKAEVSSVAYAAIPTPGLQTMIGYTDRIAIYAGVATVLGLLGYHRKKAFILRELVGLLLPALQSRTERDSAGHALFASPIAKSPSLIEPEVIPPKDSDGSSADSLYSFLALICKTYGAIIVEATDDLEPSTSSRFANGTSDSEKADEGALLAARIENESLTRAFGGRRLKMDVLFMCVAVCEVVSDLRGVVSFAGSLLRTVGSGLAPGPQDVNGAPSIGPEDQLRASGAITYAVATASNLGLGKIATEYWDDFMIRDMEILPIATDLSLTPRKKSELAAAISGAGAVKQGPFIVNQFTPRTSVSKSEPVLAVGEKFSFAVLLQNLYDINLEIESLEIDASGVKLDAKLENIVIGPYKTQRLRLIAQAKESGPMTVKGCIVKVHNCSARKYPIFRESWHPAGSTKLKGQSLPDAPERKSRPTSASSEQLKATPSKAPTASSLTARVVDSQPRVILKSTSTPQDNVIILEGEKRKISITFQNVSEKSVDFVSLSFDDSTLPILRAAVQDRELPAADLYEVEYGIYKKAALSYSPPEGDVRIDPGKDFVVEVQVLGKPGLTSGTVQLDYAALGESFSEAETFYSRRLQVSFAISVHPSVDLVRNDVFALSGPLALHEHLERHPQADPESPSYLYGNLEWTKRLMRPIRQRLAMPVESREYCLLQLDLYNSWSEAIVVRPEIRKDAVEDYPRHADWGDVFTTVESLLAGESTRFLIPVPRVNLENPYAPIPSLNPASKRQFVVSSGKTSESYERSSRDAFWHREEILKHVRIGWQAIDSERRGFVELRAIRLTMRMLDSLKLETLSVRIGVVGENYVKQIGMSHFKVTPDEFVTVRTRIVNQTGKPVHTILRLQPSIRNLSYNIALDLSRKFVYSGTLQRPLKPLGPGESLDVDLAAMFLCGGEFEIGASVEEIKLPTNDEDDSKDKGAETGPPADLDVLSDKRKDRRIWFTRETCKIDVAEST